MLVSLLFFAVWTFGTDTLSGASQLALLFSEAVAAALGMCIYKLSWTAIEHSIVSGIGDVMPSVLILLVIGGLDGKRHCAGVYPID